MSGRAITLGSVMAAGVMAGLGGCVDAVATDDAAARADQPPAVAQGDRATATYRVPLPAELADLHDLAAFGLALADARVTDDRLAVTFTLPAGLLGFDAIVQLEGARTGASDVVAIAGPLGTGACTIVGGATLRCELAYRPLAYTVDLDAVARYWQGRGDAAIDQRLIVSSLFDDDPLGVLELPLD